ncbi:MAG: hypothetical protein JZD40_06460, partial [Sulfolobus sp.]|nr:hypothetical protein [Sulfolobus sp.]
LKNEGKYDIEASLLSLLRNPMRVNQSVRAINLYSRVGNSGLIVMRGSNISSSHGMYNGEIGLAILEEPDSVANVTVPSFNTRDWGMINVIRGILVDFRDDGKVKGNEKVEVEGQEILGILTKSATLKPGEERTVVFALAWHYPNHVDFKGNRLGHYYENFFSGVNDVIRYTSENFNYLYKTVKSIIDAFYDINYESWISDLVLSQLTTLPKLSWFTKDGFFGIWEGGPGCCGLSTVDVQLWGITGVVLLYPELAKTMINYMKKHILTPDNWPFYYLIALGFPENMYKYREKLMKDPTIQNDVEKFKRTILDIVKETGKDPTGRVAHTLRSSPDVVDGYDRSDLLPEYILEALLVYYLTGDEEFIKSHWETIKAVADGLMRQHDTLNLKLPYHSQPSSYHGESVVAVNIAKELKLWAGYENVIRRLLSGPDYLLLTVNTFDTLSLSGIATLTSEMWISSLKLIIDTATIIGDKPSIDKYLKILDEANKNFISLLWNGSYFDQWYDPVTGLRDKSIMSAGLTGHWYLNSLLGMGYVISREKVISHLKNVYKYNFKEHEGLINASYPDYPRPSLKGDMKMPNGTGLDYNIGGQADTPWSGIEIPVATQMITEGLIDEGLKILKTVHERYYAWGLYWNHMECGGHYSRVTSAFVIPNALAGVTYNGVNYVLSIYPRLVKDDKFKGPILLPGSLASLEYDRKLIRMRVIIGSVKVQEVRFGDGRVANKIIINGNEIKTKAIEKGAVKFEKPLELKAGDIVEIM